MPSNGFLFEPIPHASHRLWSVQFNTFLRIAEMTNDEILQAAKESELYLDGVNQSMPLYVMKSEDLQRFAAIIEKRTIERCKEECDYVSKNARPSTVSYAYKTGADECAAAIRKLGEQ